MCTRQDVGSKAEIKIDGKPMEKNKEYKLSVGQVLEVGDSASYKVRKMLISANASRGYWKE